jgi:hypothetical protein
MVAIPIDSASFGTLRTRLPNSAALARRLVEPDVAVHAETQNLDVDAAGPRDGAFVSHALGTRIPGRAVKEVDPRRVEVHAIEQVPAHEGVIAAGIARCDTQKLVEVERDDLPKIGTAIGVESSELVVERDGSAAGG